MYKNEQGFQDKFIDYWDVVSKKFAENPNVLGYDPLNEPFPSNVMKHPFLIQPGVFDRELLGPLYEKIYRKYEANNPTGNSPLDKNIMFFEPPQIVDVIPNLGTKSIVNPVGFEVPPGSHIGSTTHVLNDHTYCCQTDSEMCEDGTPKAGMAHACLLWHHKRIGIRNEDAKRLGIPFMISEFGACIDGQGCETEIAQVT